MLPERQSLDEQLEACRLAITICRSLQQTAAPSHATLDVIQDLVRNAGGRGLTLNQLWLHFDAHARPMLRGLLDLLCRRGDLVVINKVYYPNSEPASSK